MSHSAKRPRFSSAVERDPDQDAFSRSWTRRLLGSLYSSVLVGLVWSALLAASLYINMARENRQVLSMAVAEAHSVLSKDLSFRKWVTGHGGVYVPLTESQKSVPWLAHVPGRDVTTTDGHALTLLNPASVLRQVMDDYASEFGIRGRITGLRQLNPANAPDPWEKAQMEAFARGERSEASEVTRLDGKRYLRHLQAMYMTPGCEKCHAILGYKLGDLRGAIGVNVPMEAYFHQGAQGNAQLAWTHGLVWLVGLLGIAWFGRETARHERARLRREEQLRLSEQRFRDMSDAAGAYLWELDKDLVYTHVSGPSDQVKGYAPEALIGRSPMEFMPPEEIAPVGAIVARAIAEKSSFRLQHRDLAPGGELLWEEVHGAVFCDAQGQVIGLRGTGMSINARKAAEQELLQSEQRFRDIASVSADWIWEVDAEARYTYASDGVTALLGYAPSEILGRTAFDLMPADEARRVAALFGDIVLAKRPFSDLENTVLGKDGVAHLTLTSGTPIFDAQGQLLGYRGIDRDISERRRMEEQVRQMAFYDPLTQLPNRRLINDRLSQMMASSQRGGRHGAVMFLDLDNFKPLNDQHGHRMGDLLLVEVARRLSACVRDVDTVGRFGGDEFVVMLSELDGDRAQSVAQAGRVAEKIRASLAEPYFLATPAGGAQDNRVEHHCTASIGVALFLGHEFSQGDILRAADAAMYQAKEAGRNQIRFHDAPA